MERTLAEAPQMFERYTEKARRVIFFARYESSQFGSPHIETEHLLLGLLREDKALTNRFLRTHASVESIRKQIEEHTTLRERIATTVDLPLSNDCKRVLAYAAEEAERLAHKHIGTEHLLLGLLREEKCFAAQILRDRGVRIEGVREEISKSPPDPGKTAAAEPAGPFTRDLTQAAADGQLEPVVGRDIEMEAVIATLGSRYRNHPVLVGDHGVGKSAIVEALAQRIAEGRVPPFLAEKRIVVLDPPPTSASSSEGARAENLKKIVAALTVAGSIPFVEDLRSLLTPLSTSGIHDAGTLFRSALLRSEHLWIAACAPGEFHQAVAANPWLADGIRPIHVRPLDEEATLAVLRARQSALEKFHEVTFTLEALEFAARWTPVSDATQPSTPLPDTPHVTAPAGRRFPNPAQPGRALELLDAAAAAVRLNLPRTPEDVAEVAKRIRFIVHRMEDSIANHEFEKARFYSEEQRREQENLRVLRKQYKLDESARPTVTRATLEEVLVRWSRYPCTP